MVDFLQGACCVILVPALVIGFCSIVKAVCRKILKAGERR